MNHKLDNSISKQQNIDPVLLEEIEGVIERVTFHSAETGFCVLQVKLTNNSNYKHAYLVTITGKIINISVGETIFAKGIWINDKNYGKQFKASEIVTKQPSSINAIEKYLASGLIKGVGKIYAKRMIKKFANNTLEIIEKHPKRLLEVEGIGKKRQEQIIASWSEQKIVREIMIFLQSNGVSTARASRIYKIYGDKAIDIVKENPYRLAKDIKGIGFMLADLVARNLGFAANSTARMEAAIDYILMEATNLSGHCGLVYEDLLSKTIEILNIDENDSEFDIPNKIAQIIAYKIDIDQLKLENIAEKDIIFLPIYYEYETEIAEILGSFIIKKNNFDIANLSEAISWVQKKLNISLSASQITALTNSLINNLTIITGGPGTGKTTLVKSIITILKAKKKKILLASPTGKAAKRLAQSTNMEAKTIHRLLEFNPITGDFNYNEECKLNCDVLVIDEASMLDVKLMHSLLIALPNEISLILVGDIDQLPSVGAGEVLGDIINSNALNVVQLTEIFRQAAESDIIQNAHQINQGIMPELANKTNSDFYFIASEKGEKMNILIKELVKSRIPKKFSFDSLTDIQVLCAMNVGVNGARNINQELQELFHQKDEYIEKYGNRFYVGDKIIQTENNYDDEIYNGETGFINYIDYENQKITIDFDIKQVAYNFNQLDQIALSYAITIHKSQGSEYDCVIVPVTMQSYVMLRRNLIYTAITRGKKLVIIIGEKKALALAVKEINKINRITRLKSLLENQQSLFKLK
jgi:exodeoxyribonuclease V alpha subunit